MKLRFTIFLLCVPVVSFAFLRYESKDYSMDGDVVTIQRSAVQHGIDVVIMGDGFVDKDMGLYEKAVADAAEGLFITSPAKFMREYFNIYMIRVVTPERNSSSLGINPENLGATRNEFSIIKYARKAPLSDKNRFFVIVIINTPKHNSRDGFSTPVNIMNNRDSYLSFVDLHKTGRNRYDVNNLKLIISHEAVGHAIGLLGDEYSIWEEQILNSDKTKIVNDAKLFGANANLDFCGEDTAQVKWSKFIGLPDYPEVGIFQGGATYHFGVWRPSQNSIMRNDKEADGKKFNAPSRDAIYKRIKELTGEAYAFEEFLKFDKEHGF